MNGGESREENDDDNAMKFNRCTLINVLMSLNSWIGLIWMTIRERKLLSPSNLLFSASSINSDLPWIIKLCSKRCSSEIEYFWEVIGPAPIFKGRADSLHLTQMSNKLYSPRGSLSTWKLLVLCDNLQKFIVLWRMNGPCLVSTSQQYFWRIEIHISYVGRIHRCCFCSDWKKNHSLSLYLSNVIVAVQILYVWLLLLIYLALSRSPSYH